MSVPITLIRYEVRGEYLDPEQYDRLPESEKDLAKVHEIPSIVECWGVYYPAQLYGPPDTCYPEECDFEATEVTPMDRARYGLLDLVLSLAEGDQIEEQYWTTCEEQNGWRGQQYEYLP
jgi:hypothetical protein